MKYNSIYNNFGAGELSRNLHGRTDLEEYFKGVSEMTNFVPTRSGGATFRTGSCVVSSGYNTASFVAEFSPRDNEKYLVLLQPGRPISIINSDGTSGSITQPLYPWNYHIDFSSASSAYTFPSDDSELREFVDSLSIASSSDTLIIVDGTGKLAPIVILRTDVNVFVVDSFINPTQNNSLGVPYITPPHLPLRVPYKDTNLSTNIRLKPSGTTGTITIISENASAASIPFFKGDVTGMLVRITHTGTTGVALITSKASDSSVTALVITPFAATTTQTDFSVSAWNPHDGYPRSICFFEGRLILGGNKNFPDTIWCSATGNIYHFMQTRLAQDASTNTSGYNFFGGVKLTDPFSFIPAAVGANNIQWLYPSDSLLVGTTNNEFSISGGNESALSLSSIFVKAISAHGSSKVQPIKVGSSVLFVSIDGKRVLEIPKRLVEYTAATDWSGLASGIVEKAIEAVSLNLNNTKPINSKIVKMTWDETTSLLWCICKNSISNETTLISLTVDKTVKVVAWAKHKIGGTPFISSIVAIPDSTNVGNKRVFVFLKRSNGIKYTLESFTYRSMHDSHLPLTIGSGTRPLTSYLDGARFGLTGTPDILRIEADHRDAFPPGFTYGVIQVNATTGIGTYLGSFTDTNLTSGTGYGELNIPGYNQADTYIIGALYEGLIKTMPIEAGAQFGVAQGSLRRGHEISIYVDRSLGGTYKASKALNEFPIVGSKGTPTALYTGEIKLSLNASPDDSQTVIKQTLPYPLTILWLLTKGNTYDV